MDPVPRRTNRKFPIRAAAYLLLSAVLMTLAVCALSAVLIRSVDSVLLHAGQEDFAEIFAQLEDAELEPNGTIPLILALLFLTAIGLLILKIGGWAVIPAVLLGILLFVLSLAAAVWFTDVNGIRFGTVVLSLLDLMEAGAF